eukprot:s1245_g8.t1
MKDPIFSICMTKVKLSEHYQDGCLTGSQASHPSWTFYVPIPSIAPISDKALNVAEILQPSLHGKIWALLRKHAGQKVTVEDAVPFFECRFAASLLGCLTYGSPEVALLKVAMPTAMTPSLLSFVGGLTDVWIQSATETVLAEKPGLCWNLGTSKLMCGKVEDPVHAGEYLKRKRASEQSASEKRTAVFKKDASNRRKFRSQTSDSMDRWKSSARKKVRKREDQRGRKSEERRCRLFWTRNLEPSNMALWKAGKIRVSTIFALLMKTGSKKRKEQEQEVAVGGYLL